MSIRLRQSKFYLPASWARPLGPVSGFLTGAVNGITSRQVMPAIPQLMVLHLDRNLFVQAINCSFTMSSLIMAVGLKRMELFTTDATIVSVIGVVLAFGGVRFGVRIRHCLSPDAFCLTLLALMGSSLVVRAF